MIEVICLATQFKPQTLATSASYHKPTYFTQNYLNPSSQQQNPPGCFPHFRAIALGFKKKSK